MSTLSQTGTILLNSDMLMLTQVIASGQDGGIYPERALGANGINLPASFLQFDRVVA